MLRKYLNCHSKNIMNCSLHVYIDRRSFSDIILSSIRFTYCSDFYLRMKFSKSLYSTAVNDIYVSKCKNYSSVQRKLKIYPLNYFSHKAHPTSQKSHDYTDSLLLPKTSFKVKSNLADELSYYASEQKQNKDIYEAQKLDPKRTTPYTLLDGPPFANGLPHIGHALNKIIKDIIVRYKIMRGYSVRMLPGWDVHGLPIEMKVLEELKQKSLNDTRNDPDKSLSKESSSSSTSSSSSYSHFQNSESSNDSSSNVYLADQFSSKSSLDSLSSSSTSDSLILRKVASQFAKKYIEIQKSEFKKWGILGDWESHYTTMDKNFERNQLLIFQKMVQKGLIYRALKPVHWSPTSKTALAEAELEYFDMKSKTVFYSYPLENFFLPDGSIIEHPIALALWTSTPWTIPSNKAVAIHRSFPYVLIKVEGFRSYYVVSKDLIAFLEKKVFFKKVLIVSDSFNGSHLLQFSYLDDLFTDEKRPIIHADFVTNDSGTGLVHLAPAHGLDDCLVTMENGIKCDSCIVNANGIYSNEAPIFLQGLAVLNSGNERMIEFLKEKDSLLTTYEVTHSYPHDWRTKEPTIIRMTHQWFVSLAQVKDSLDSVLANVDMSEIGKSRLLSMIHHRTEWCISRQRSWGLPIPAFYDEDGKPLMTKNSIEYIAEIFNRHGSDAWWSLSVDELLAPEYRDNGHTYTKGMDTMDVWFDSGTSWSTIMSTGKSLSGSSNLIDIIIEGSDQYRGWFQSMLITSICSRGIAPYKKVLSHGFVLDEDGKKMSKSLGNVVSPTDIFFGSSSSSDKPHWKPFGIDVVRMWVASTDTSLDVRIGSTILERISENKDKLRNTARFMIGNLQDFSSSQAVDHHCLPELERYILALLYKLMTDVDIAYESFEFKRVLTAVSHFASSELSSFYFDIIKDTLYADNESGFYRRSAQTVLSKILPMYCQSIAPILCFTGDEIFSHMRTLLKMDDRIDSPIIHPYLYPDPTWKNELLVEEWENIRKVKAVVNRLVQQARADKHISKSVEMDLTLGINTEKFSSLWSLMKKNEHQLPSVFLVSQVIISNNLVLKQNQDAHSNYQSSVEMENGSSNIDICLSLSKRNKCPRCWLFASDREDKLCGRCHQVINVDHALLGDNIFEKDIKENQSQSELVL